MGLEVLELNGKKISFGKVEGTVLGTRKISSTEVHSDGGGGFITQYGGVIQPASVWSESSMSVEFWLSTEEGKEFPIKLADTDIPLRDGQRVAMVFAECNNKSHWVVLINRNAQQFWIIASMRMAIKRLFGISQYDEPYHWLFFFGLLLIGIAGSAIAAIMKTPKDGIFAIFWLSGLFGGVIAISRESRKRAKRKTLISILNNHLNEIGKAW